MMPGATSSPIRKKRKLELDRISNLPDDLTQQILSYLPFKEAGRTSILSRHWRFQWAMLPSLAFDLFIDDPYVVDHVLLLHDGPIHSFKPSTKYAMDIIAMDRWIRHLSKTPIKQFIVKGYKRSRLYRPYVVPSSLFSCQHLTHLELSNCSLSLPPTFKGFRNLKTLDIQRAIVPQLELEKLIVYSLLLERLTVCHLKDIARLKIDAPNLQFLKVGEEFEDVELVNTLNLVHVSLDRKWPCGRWDILLRSTPTLRELEISFRQEQEYWGRQKNEEATSWKLPKLQRLKVTGFSGAEDELEFIKFLLISSPALQELHILYEETKKRDNSIKIQRVDDAAMANQNFASTQLRVLNIIGFSPKLK
ncbi:F-box/FBD/LRR-repeat protein At1g13570-like [Argentina anserina]|uniref:F-box/FBD/LRR-repeat protein At1g13570-like n=1 Tax=Argentina anserina TaxID=57926 RepID=UPI0021765492|nr:F-box/FBD/LRR-repeat protein At1g13570-like [Potentilla anserina]